MTEYIDIVLTEAGVFCIAPPWEITEGDYISMPDVLTGEKRLLKVTSVATDKADGDHIKMIEKYIGYPLPKVKEKYKCFPVGREEENVQE